MIMSMDLNLELQLEVANMFYAMLCEELPIKSIRVRWWIIEAAIYHHIDYDAAAIYVFELIWGKIDDLHKSIGIIKQELRI